MNEIFAHVSLLVCPKIHISRSCTRFHVLSQIDTRLQKFTFISRYRVSIPELRRQFLIKLHTFIHFRGLQTSHTVSIAIDPESLNWSPRCWCFVVWFMNKIRRNRAGESLAKSVFCYRDIFTRGCLLMKVLRSSSIYAWYIRSIEFVEILFRGCIMLR